MKKVLVIDDSKFWRLFLSDVVNSLGCEVKTAESGISGVNEALKFLPDLVITDYNMPDISGLYVSMVLRSIPEFQSIGIIILTGSEDVINEYWAKKSGANKFLSKLIGKDRIKSELSVFLDNGFYAGNLNDNRSFTFEDIYQVIEKKMKSEIIKREILGFLKYIRDEKHVMNSLKKLISHFTSFTGFYSALLSPSEGRIYNLSEKVNPNHLKALLLSFLNKPITPSKWSYTGAFDENSQRRIKNYYAQPICYENEEIGIILLENPAFTVGLREFLKEAIESLGMLFSTLNNFKEYNNAALLDGLTGLLNKKSLIESIENMMEKYKNDLTLAMFDIDNFKQVNDIYGHLTGDLVLKEIAKIFLEVIDEKAMAGRYGGEEFIIVFKSPDMAIKFVEKIYEKIQSYNWKKVIGDDKKITISGGIARNQEGYTVTDLISAADMLLYKAKKDGKNRFYVSMFKTKGRHLLL
ncbi:diguanylate cyclase [Thermosipho ferrireducens]|uniref:Diguanylate cyclase n=1 Tax=Thermosipho ferrireducens TaxID=2571116 RepID=A0ABX7S7A7_9BACT|nr:diguanylate cyclase [Thermosipho ferrireducens]QTA37731.1 diguanylate cyclase [Thermosipho ferrireducens]